LQLVIGVADACDHNTRVVRGKLQWPLQLARVPHDARHLLLLPPAGGEIVEGCVVCVALRLETHFLQDAEPRVETGLVQERERLLGRLLGGRGGQLVLGGSGLQRGRLSVRCNPLACARPAWGCQLGLPLRDLQLTASAAALAVYLAVVCLAAALANRLRGLRCGGVAEQRFVTGDCDGLARGVRDNVARARDLCATLSLQRFQLLQVVGE
jgi:hypothetical protein